MSAILITDAFDLDVVVLQPDAHYTVKLFGSSTSGCPDSDERTFEFDWTNSKNGTSLAIEGIEYMYYTQSMPAMLHAWLYVDLPIEGLSISSTTLLARGYIAYSDIKTGGTATIDLTNCGEREQVLAQICVRIKRANTGKSISVKDESCVVRKFESNRDALYESFHSEVVNAYIKLKGMFNADLPAHSVFYYVDTNVRRYPITTFGYSSTMTNNDMNEIHALLSAMAASICPTHATIYEMLVDMCTMITKPLVYVEDTAKRLDGKQEPIDQWLQIGTFPHVATAGFDCEDGAGLIMSIVTVLRHTKIRSDTPILLQQLITLVNQYTPFLTLGNLKAGLMTGDYVSHAYVTLLDARYVEHQLSGCQGRAPSGLHPALTLESTASLSGVWNRDALAPIDSSSSTMSQHYSSIRAELRVVFDDALPLMSACRQFTPLQASNVPKWRNNGTNHCGAYEDAYVLMTTDHTRRVDGGDKSFAAHLIVTSDTRVGTPAERLMMYDDKVRLHTVSLQTRAEFKNQFSSLWEQQPKNNLPKPSFCSAEIEVDTKKAIVGYLDVPMRVWDAYKIDIRDRLHHLRQYSVSEVRINIAYDMSVMRIYFHNDPADL